MTNKNDSKLPFYFSIDFEDFYYDSLRAININNPETKSTALKLSYNSIKKICKKYFKDKKLTFFVTGVLCEKAPNLIKQISDDGHEIACHYNYHDNINLSNKVEFAENLDQAIDRIKRVVGYKPLGFRAPNFAIDPDNTWAYEELSKRFSYDSSYKTSASIAELKPQKNFQFENNELKEYFIYSMPMISNLIKMRSGGTYFRLFPEKLILKTMMSAHNKGHIPLIYMHPYEMIENRGFWISWKDLNSIKLVKRTYVWARQMQWSHLGHRSVERKISYICKYFEHQGPMKNLLD
tara:strand:- start:213 stop:1091 length:879 start_codon:yes stop_codon:yes gene_type:complete